MGLYCVQGCNEESENSWNSDPYCAHHFWYCKSCSKKFDSLESDGFICETCMSFTFDTAECGGVVKEEVTTKNSIFVPCRKAFAEILDGTQHRATAAAHPINVEIEELSPVLSPAPAPFPTRVSIGVLSPMALPLPPHPSSDKTSSILRRITSSILLQMGY